MIDICFIVLKLLSPVRPHAKATSLSPKFHPNEGQQYGAPSLLYDSESSSDSSISSPTTPTEAHATLQSLLYRGVEPRAEEIPRTIVYIDLWTDQPSPPIDGETPWTSSDEALEEEHSWIERGHKVERSSQQPRVLREIDPTVTLMSQTAISAQSHFAVHTDDGIVFSETTTLQPLDLSHAPTTNGFLYKTPLVPGFWETILGKPGKRKHHISSSLLTPLNSSDASKYVIIQRVMSDASSSSSSPSTPIFSAMYKFNYATQQSSEPSTSHAETQLSQSSQSNPPANVTMPVPLIAEPRTDYDFDDIDFQLDAQSLNDMFSLSKNSQLFDLGSFMPFNDSVYPRPVHYTNQMGYALENANVQHMLTPTTMPAFPPADLSIYVRVPFLCMFPVFLPLVCIPRDSDLSISIHLRRKDLCCTFIHDPYIYHSLIQLFLFFVSSFMFPTSLNSR